MHSQRNTGAARMAGLAMVAALLAAPQWASAQAEPLKGMISAREGSQITVKGADGGLTVLELTPSTKVTATGGALGLDKDARSPEDLITGLPVTIETAAGEGGKTYAAEVKFKASDMKTARQIQAGTAEVEAQNKELRERLSQANQYVEVDQLTVLFPVGSATISERSKTELQAIGAKAAATKGYMISVVGYADPTGNAQANQRLSYRRAVAVTRYLQKFCGVEPARVLAADSMGEDKVVGDTSTQAGLAQNRRVVVKIVTNKGLQGL